MTYRIVFYNSSDTFTFITEFAFEKSTFNRQASFGLSIRLSAKLVLIENRKRNMAG